jgi:4-aminobutyrate aminotransferase-like enzyme
MENPVPENHAPNLLAAQRLAHDPRIAQAKELLTQVVRDHQQELNQVRPPRPELTAGYAEKVAKFEGLRGGSLYFPYLSAGLGNGPYVELADGSVKLDLITGIGVHGMGHSNPELVSTGIDAVLCDTVMQGNLQQNEPSVELTELLVKLATESGSDLQHCVLTTSGAMANENALKIAFQKNAPAQRVFAFENCFCGRSIALSNMTDRPNYRVGLPVTTTVDYLPFYDYRDPAGSLKRTMAIFEKQVARYPKQHAILWMELIAGEGGYYAGSREFFQTLAGRARELGIAVICDEVQTFSRTHRPYAFQYFELDSLVDIVTIGKITQVCATLFTSDYKPKPGLVSQTFTGNSASILAGLKIVRGLVERGHFTRDPSSSKTMQLHDLFVGGIKAIEAKYPGSLQGPYGLGGMVGFTPFDGSAAVAKELTMKLYEAGLMGFIAGDAPSRVRFLMPLLVTQPHHIQEACGILENVVAQMVAGRRG